MNRVCSMSSKYYPGIDLLKFVLAIFIVLHHAEIILFNQKGDFANYFGTAYLAVEGFLIVSGYFIAQSARKISSESSFFEVVYHRLKNIYPPYVYSLFVCIVVNEIILRLLGYRLVSWMDYLYTIFIIGGLFVGNAVIGFWYMPIFFWGGAFLQWLLVYKNKISVSIIIPAICLLLYSWIYHQFGSLPLHSEPYLGTFVSGGVLRGLAGLSFGILLFYFIDKIKDYGVTIKPYIAIIVGLIISILLFKLLTGSSASKKDFLVLFLFPIYFAILRCVTLNGILENLAKKMGILSYYIFLVHIIVINGLNCLNIFNGQARIIVLSAVVFFTAILSLIMFLTQKQFNKISISLLKSFVKSNC